MSSFHNSACAWHLYLGSGGALCFHWNSLRRGVDRDGRARADEGELVKPEAAADSSRG